MPRKKNKIVERRMANGLTAQQDLFAHNVAAGNKLQDAAIAAGYSAHSACSQASKLIKLEKVAQAVKEYAGRNAAALHLDATFVLEGLMRNAQTGQREEPVISRHGEVVGSRPVDLGASNSAYGLLGKHLRLWVDRTSIELGDGVRDFLNDVVRIIDEEVTDEDTRNRVTARLAVMANEQQGA